MSFLKKIRALLTETIDGTIQIKQENTNEEKKPQALPPVSSYEHIDTHTESNQKDDNLNEPYPNTGSQPIPKKIMAEIQMAIVIDYYNGHLAEQTAPIYLNELTGYKVPQILSKAKAEGYLRAPTSQEVLSRLTIPDLKAILKQNNLKVGGKKADLIDRILENVPNEQYISNGKGIIILSDTGKSLVDRNYIYIRHKYGDTPIHFRAIYNCIKGFGCEATKENYFRVKNSLLLKDLYTNIAAKNWIAASYNYYHMAELNLEIGDYPKALSLFFNVLYLNLSGMDNNNVVESYSRLFLPPDLINQLNKLTFALQLSPTDINNSFDTAVQEISALVPFSYFSIEDMKYILADILSGNCPLTISDNPCYLSMKNTPLSNSKKYTYYDFLEHI